MLARKPKRPLLRRTLLASLALAAFAGPPAASGCSAGFTPISQVDALRVLAVVADKPYAQPGDEVTFTLTYDDAFPRSGDAGPRPLSFLWLAGCIDPAGDEYYGCYSQFAAGASGLDLTSLPPGFAVGSDDTFTWKLPSDLITGPAPNPQSPRSYGLAIVFFAVCAGTIGPAPADGNGLAGSFPLGCFDAAGNALGADSFVPGYTQVYAFADGRTNRNPHADGLMLNGAPIPEARSVTGGGLMVEPVGPVQSCPVAEANRGSAGCGKTDPSKACTDYELSVFFKDPASVAEIDPSSSTADGGAILEEVWVDYFADQGDIDSPVLLVNDATTGLQASYSTRWYAPPNAGTVRLWAVVHDSRGGESVIERQLQVE